MIRPARICLLTGLVGFILAQTSFGLYPAKGERTHDSTSVAVRPVTIVSQPTGCGIWLNGKYAGKTPLVVHVAVDLEGRCLKGLEVRAIRPPPFTVEEVRNFPAASVDGATSFVPSVIWLDLFIQRVFVIR